MMVYLAAGALMNTGDLFPSWSQSAHCCSQPPLSTHPRWHAPATAYTTRSLQDDLSLSRRFTHVRIKASDERSVRPQTPETVGYNSSEWYPRTRSNPMVAAISCLSDQQA
jgi:hypothetical protein